MSMQKWVKMPTNWITQKRRLNDLRWTTTQGEGANNIAALMSLIVVAHHAGETGLASLTYDHLSDSTGLSRAKISGGLSVLEKMELIERRGSGRSSLQLTDYDPSEGWGKLPARGLYSSNRVAFFSTMSLRKAAELHALKLYLLFVAMRDNKSNLANISYDSIEYYTGINRHQIKPGLSILAANGVVHVEHFKSWGEIGIANAYRVAFIEERQHLGTTGRALLANWTPPIANVE